MPVSNVVLKADLPPAGPALPKAQRSFAADVFKLASGTATAQIISMLSAPFLAHLFAPAAFGDAAIFVAITGLITSVVGMRFELSIVLPDQDGEAANAMAVSLCFVLAITGSTILLLLAGGKPLLHLLRAEELSSYLWLIPVTVFVNGIYAALYYWSVRKNYFGHFSVSQVASTLFFVLAQLIAGLAGHATRGTIIYATVGAALVSTTILLVTSWLPWARLFVHNVRWRKMTATLKRYISFPKFSAGSAVLHNLSMQLPNFFLSAFFSPTVVGYYSMGNRLLQMPVNLIGQNVATVFYPRVAEAKNAGSITSPIERVFRYLCALTLFPCLLLSLTGKDLLVVALGGKWAEAGIYTQILSPWLMVWFISIPLGTVLSALEKQALELRMVVTIITARVISLAIGGAIFRDARWTLALLSATGVLVMGYYCYVVLRQCNVTMAYVGRVVGENVATFMPAGIIIVILRYTVGARPLVIVAVSVFLMAVYYLNLIRTDAIARMLLKNLLQRFTPERMRSKPEGVC